MTTAVLAPPFIVKSWTNNGLPNAFGTLATYAGGSATPIATYTDSTGGTPNANPITFNARGEASVWLTPNVAYKFVEADSTGAIFRTTDQVVQSQLISLYGGVDTGIANQYVLTFAASFSSYTDGIVLFWIPSNNNSGPSTINVNGLGAVPIVNPNGTVLGANQIIATQITEIAYIGGVFQLVGGAGVGANVGTFGTETPLAAAATVDLGSATAHNVQIVGAASITSFGTSAQIVAPIFVVRMSGVCTLTSSSSLILPGGTSIVTASGDAFLAEYMGNSNWRVLIYQYASGVANVKVKAADTALISTTTLTQDPELLTSTLPIGKYAFKVYLLFDSVSAAAGFKWSSSGTAVDSRGVVPAITFGSVNAAAYGPKAESFYSATISYATVSNTSNSNQVTYEGSLLVGTPGTVGIQWAQNSSTASNTTLRAGSYLSLSFLGAGASSSATTRIYTTPGSGVETIPAGVSTLTLEVWGGGGSGGARFGTSGAAAGGGGGGAGGYAYTSISVAGLAGQTINYVVGAGGVGTFAGAASTVTSGTFAIASMTAGGGSPGTSATNLATPGTGGAGGAASGGTVANTTGNAGQAGYYNGIGIGGNGGAGTAGINYGTGGGGRGAGQSSATINPGAGGAIAFNYA